MNLKPVLIEARDMPDAWFQCIARILEVGNNYKITKGSYEGAIRREFDYITVHVKHPGVRPLIPDIPPGLGIPPPTTMEYVEQYLPYLMTDKVEPNETYTYGQRLFGFKQVEKVIEMYKRGHGTNQATMEIGRPEDCGTEDPPCLRLIDTRIKNGKLHFALYFRSWDLWAGFPSNLAAIQILKEYMASEIGLEDGEIIASSKGLHLYDYTFDLAKIRTYRMEGKIEKT